MSIKRPVLVEDHGEISFLVHEDGRQFHLDKYNVHEAAACINLAPRMVELLRSWVYDEATRKVAAQWGRDTVAEIDGLLAEWDAAINPTDQDTHTRAPYRRAAHSV